MELDFKAVKALSSPTRVKILHQVLEKESTPTQLSDNLDKSKSTISSHLTTLHKAGLVEKDQEEGRKRVSYSPTRKARAIVEGRERKVRFTIASSALSMMVALVAMGSGAQELFRDSYQSEQRTMDAMTMGQESAGTAAQEAPSTLMNLSPEILLFVGAGFLTFSALGVLYAFTINRLSG
ncbi:MAG: DNA-binding transcriptional ArsR family regulator [Candidatus Nanohaloarchaea archaeon]|jgi:DNA-binding transcriptional ArsR family regulator